MPVKRTQAHPRSRARLVARFGPDRPERTGFTTNLSMSGAFVHTNLAYRPGTQLKVELVAGESKVALTARVIWAKVVPAGLGHLMPCGMGLRFIDPGPAWSSFFEQWRSGPAASPRST